MLNDKEENAEFWTECASARRYFLISRIILKISDDNMVTEPFCIVEYEDIAIDFCKKHPQFTYTEEGAICYGN